MEVVRKKGACSFVIWQAEEDVKALEGEAVFRVSFEFVVKVVRS